MAHLTQLILGSKSAAAEKGRPVVLLRQQYITREDLRLNPQVIYLFGDNMLHVGLGGQAAEMRGQDNAVGIPTKWAPGADPEDYFYDDMSLADWHAATYTIQHAFVFAYERAASMSGIVIVSAAGLGTGLSDLQNKAPRLLKYINDILANFSNPAAWPHAYPR